MPAVIKPARTLWHEVIGFLFLVLAILPLFSTYRAIRDFDGEPANLFKIGLSLAFIAIMSYYGVTSFLRARKISRS